MKKTLTAVAAVVLAVTFAAPAQAATTADADDVRYLTRLARAAWSSLDYVDRANICDLYTYAPTVAVPSMAEALHDATDYQYRYRDVRTAARRLLAGSC